MGVLQTEENKDINEEEVESVAPTTAEVDKIEDETLQVETKNVQGESASEDPAENPTGESCDTTSMVSHMVQQTEEVESVAPTVPKVDEIEDEVPQVDTKNVQEESASEVPAESSTGESCDTTSMVSHMVQQTNVDSETSPNTSEDIENKVLESDIVVENKQDEVLEQEEPAGVV